MTIQAAVSGTVDDTELVGRLRGDYKKVTSPDSGLPKLSHIGIMLKFFIAPLLLRSGQVDEAAKTAGELMKDIRSYFGHEMTEMILDPMLILLHQKFDQFTQMTMNPPAAVAPEQVGQMRVMQAEILKDAKEIEDRALALQGDQSEKLIEVFCLYSFFHFQAGDLQAGVRMQRKASDLSLRFFGAESPNYIQRLQEQLAMVTNSGDAGILKDAVKDAEEANRLALTVFSKPQDEH